MLICETCGCIVDRPVTITKGSFWIEIVLWFFFLVPGLIYTIWRLTTRYHACPACRGGSLLPLGSPRGKILSREYYTSGLRIRKKPELPISWGLLVFAAAGIIILAAVMGQIVLRLLP